MYLPQSTSNKVSTEMGAGIPSLYVTTYPGQLSLLPSAEWEVNTGHGQEAVVALFGVADCDIFTNGK